ncbi:efflux RND transporter periplasmic adaptor subunit [Undibacterium sp. CY7W]|uniref:Efflux RND transporter periplasmic adaptor subunit n=1 Tax=Undibacterium rugosum TaxID=2762291 RepID=A0A923KV91_9BURK|nr:efflux RND transporter periplasmic adaptor subunit [Undibacterium rugosum]MBC3935092.1 efflux RND transporter periplasmic adaptor subunit [Undibacterium rugosum]
MSQLKTITLVAAIAALAAGGYYAYQSSAPKNPESANTKNADASAKSSASASASALAGKGDSRPVSVSTILTQKKDFPVRLQANGVVSSLNTVDIRPQITSTVTRVHIKEGQFVRAGELLVTLDSRNDEVNLAKAQAQLDKDMATLADLQRQLVRSKDLVSKKFVAQSALDTSQTQVDAQQAVIASDKAAVNAAKVALSYNRIIAPASGRTGIISVFVGSLVQPNATATPMVTITQIDPIAVTFPLPQRHLNDALQSMRNADSFVQASLPDGQGKYKGKLQFVDNVVDAASGTVKVKAVFDNKEMKLWPGAYVNLDMSVRTIKDAVVVPQDAIVVGARGKSVYVVNAESKAEVKPVTVLESYGNEAVISGVDAGVKIVLDGKQNLRPGGLLKERSADDKDSAKAQDGKEAKEGKPAKAAEAHSASAASAS